MRFLLVVPHRPIVNSFEAAGAAPSSPQRCQLCNRASMPPQTVTSRPPDPSVFVSASQCPTHARVSSHVQTCVSYRHGPVWSATQDIAKAFQVPCMARLTLMAPSSLWLTRPHRNLALVEVLATAIGLTAPPSGAACAFGNLPYSWRG